MLAAQLTDDTPVVMDGSRRRILFLVHRIPYPPDKGDRIRSYHLLKKLSRVGEVDLAFLSDEPPGVEALTALCGLCHRVEGVPIARIERWIRAGLSLAFGRSLTEGLFESSYMDSLIGKWLEDTYYDAVICFSSGVLPYVLRRGLEPRLIVDIVDVDSQKWFDYAEGARGLMRTVFRLEGHRVRALEQAASRALAVVLVTEIEADIYRSFSPEARVEVVRNGVDLEYFRPMCDNEGGGTCVFVGQLDYRANVLGLERFCRVVWPKVRESVPDARFQIVGRNPTISVRRLGAIAGVEVVGPVADVRAYLSAARFVVVPLPVARGIQNKVLEAMAMGLAVIASPEALEGLSLVKGRDALSASNSHEWAKSVITLWNDPRRCAELGLNARKYAEAFHQWDECLEVILDIIN